GSFLVSRTAQERGQALGCSGPTLLAGAITRSLGFRLQGSFQEVGGPLAIPMSPHRCPSGDCCPRLGVTPAVLFSGVSRMAKLSAVLIAAIFLTGSVLADIPVEQPTKV